MGSVFSSQGGGDRGYEYHQKKEITGVAEINTNIAYWVQLILLEQHTTAISQRTVRINTQINSSYNVIILTSLGWHPTCQSYVVALERHFSIFPKGVFVEAFKNLQRYGGIRI